MDAEGGGRGGVWGDKGIAGTPAMAGRLGDLFAGDLFADITLTKLH